MKFAALVPVVLILAVTPVAARDGQTAYNNACRTCHSLKPHDNRLGPTLAGIVGRKAGTIEGFAFSDSLRNSGLVWDELTLDKFIENPDAVVLGHRMKPFGGVLDPALRAAIVQYLVKVP